MACSAAQVALVVESVLAFPRSFYVIQKAEKRSTGFHEKERDGRILRLLQR
jgi:hypothetical protein